MDPGMRTSASGMRAQQIKVDVIANNLANVNTTGYKRSQVAFQDVLYDTIQGSRNVDTTSGGTIGPMQVGRGVRVAGIVRVHSQGAPEFTQRPFDMAIQGEGMYQVRMPSGEFAYTRDGSFQLSDSGSLVTSDGYELVPAIVVPPEASSIGISKTGLVSASVGADGASIDIGQIELAKFVNPSGLEAAGGNLYLETEASGEPEIGLAASEGFGMILQSHLETSNVEIVQEMVDMIAAQRAYEINSKAIRVAEEMIQVAANDIIR